MKGLSNAVTASRIAALVIGVALVPGVARSAPPCEADVKKFCSDVPIGSGRVAACLQEHAKDLSPECAKEHKEFEQEMGRAAAMCRYDIMLFCSDVSPGQGRLARCLGDNRDSLSPVCKTEVDKLTKQ